MTQFPLIWYICTMYILHRRWPRRTGVSAWCTFLNSLSVLVSILLTAPVYAEAWCPLESKLRCKPQAYESSGIHYNVIQVNPSLFLLFSSTFEHATFNVHYGLDMQTFVYLNILHALVVHFYSFNSFIPYLVLRLLITQHRYCINIFLQFPLW